MFYIDSHGVVHRVAGKTIPEMVVEIESEYK